MNKEEMLSKENYKWINGSSYSSLTEGEIKTIYEAMDEYAQQETASLRSEIERLKEKIKFLEMSVEQAKDELNHPF